MPAYLCHQLIQCFFIFHAQSVLHYYPSTLGRPCHIGTSTIYISKVKPGTHTTPGWREAQSRLTSCLKILSQMKQWVVPGLNPVTCSYNSNTHSKEPTRPFIIVTTQLTLIYVESLYCNFYSINIHTVKFFAIFTQKNQVKFVAPSGLKNYE